MTTASFSPFVAATPPFALMEEGEGEACVSNHEDRGYPTNLTELSGLSPSSTSARLRRNSAARVGAAQVHGDEMPPSPHNVADAAPNRSARCSDCRTRRERVTNKI